VLVGIKAGMLEVETFLMPVGGLGQKRGSGRASTDLSGLLGSSEQCTTLSAQLAW